MWGLWDITYRGRALELLELVLLPEDLLGLLLSPAAQRHVVHGANHWDLLDHPEVSERLRHWLA